MPKQRKYKGYFIGGSKSEGYWSSCMGYDIRAKTVEEVKEKIHRLLYSGMPKRKSVKRR